MMGPTLGTGVRTGKLGELPITAPSASCLVWKSSFLMPVHVCTRVCAGVHA